MLLMLQVDIACEQDALQGCTGTQACQLRRRLAGWLRMNSAPVSTRCRGRCPSPEKAQASDQPWVAGKDLLQSAAQGVREGTSQMHPTLYPILVLLSRLRHATQAAGSTEVLLLHLHAH